MKFKVGDKVRVKMDLITKKNYNGVIFSEEMKKFKGLKFYIRSTVVYGNTLNGIERYFFTDDMLELVEQPTKDPSKFTKADLKTKMVVEVKDGNRYLVVDDTLVRYEGYNPLNVYNDDLTCDTDSVSIEKVFRYVSDIDVDCVSLKNMLSSQNLSLVWERPQLKPITKAELAKMGYKLEDK
jgi:hypothetical protein